jgi:hypothetical protein
MHIVGKVQMILPVDNLSIHVVCVFRAERRVAYEVSLGAVGGTDRLNTRT